MSKEFFKRAFASIVIFLVAIYATFNSGFDYALVEQLGNVGKEIKNAIEIKDWSAITVSATAALRIIYHYFTTTKNEER